MGAAASQFVGLLPALWVGWLAARGMEFLAVSRTNNLPEDLPRVVASALVFDLLFLLQAIPVLFLLFLAGSRLRHALFLVLGGGLIIVQVALGQYFATASVPLGSDLFGYSAHDVWHVATASGSFGVLSAAGFLVSLLAFAAAAFFLRRHARVPPRVAWIVLAVGASFLLFAPMTPGSAADEPEFRRSVVVNKTSFFVASTASYFLVTESLQDVQNSGVSEMKYLDPQYPFLRLEQTPDALGEFFHVDPSVRPNFVFFVVEGLGRSFSGPDADLGSFTPFADELRGRSLYWENFLATQGRTFAVLPSLFGSLPFGEKGFSDLGTRAPPHATFLTLLKNAGYTTKFYYGADIDFDNERIFLERQGMDRIVGGAPFEAEYVRSPGVESWGYADRDTMRKALAMEFADTRAPFVTIVQTMTMHTPYLFPGQERYYPLFEERMRQIGLSEAARAKHRTYRNIYTSVMYFDDCLKMFLEEFAKHPGYRNTIFIITGDHRLPEIPMATKIDRYHVPLLIFSPMLKKTGSFRSVSSHFDVAPSLLALLSKNYGLRTPRAVTWLGQGLDVEPEFRNVHEYAIKHTTTELTEFVAGREFLCEGRLYTLDARLNPEAVNDDSRLRHVRGLFDGFRSANRRFAATLALAPPNALTEMVSYEERAEFLDNRFSTAAVPSSPIEARQATYPPEVRRGTPLHVRVSFVASKETAPAEFVPLIVVVDARAREIQEVSGHLRRTEPGGEMEVEMDVPTGRLPPGSYFMAILPSDPNSGRPIGTGLYHKPFTVR